MRGCATGPCSHPLGPTRCPVCRWLHVGSHMPEDDTRRVRNVTRDGAPRVAGARTRAGTASKRRAGPNWVPRERRPAPVIQKTTAKR